ncbi:MAG: hypothetical protein NWS86_00555, partial [Flavobacteriales bacterium]|nr:hypothetical protein [Flavobacteriales bacterium]
QALNQVRNERECNAGWVYRVSSTLSFQVGQVLQRFFFLTVAQDEAPRHNATSKNRVIADLNFITQK